MKQQRHKTRYIDITLDHWAIPISVMYSKGIGMRLQILCISIGYIEYLSTKI